MVELLIESISGINLPKDLFVSFRLGEVQKLSRLEGGRSFRFPVTPASPSNKRFARAEVFQRVATCSFDAGHEGPRAVSLDCGALGGGHLGLDIAVKTNPGSPESTKLGSKQASQSRSAKAEAAKQYLDAHHLEAELSLAMQALLQEKPQNPGEYLARKLLERYGEKPPPILPTHCATAPPPLPARDAKAHPIDDEGGCGEKQPPPLPARDAPMQPLDDILESEQAPKSMAFISPRVPLQGEEASRRRRARSPSVEGLRSSVFEALMKGVQSGQLEAAFASSMRHIPADAVPEIPTEVTDAEERQRAGDTVVEALRDGRLEASLPPPLDLNSLRHRVGDMMAASLRDGRLEVAVKQVREEQLEEMRGAFCGKLLSEFEKGRLEAAVIAIASRNRGEEPPRDEAVAALLNAVGSGCLQDAVNAVAPRSEDVEALRAEASSILLSGAERGSLESAVEAVAAARRDRGAQDLRAEGERILVSAAQSGSLEKAVVACRERGAQVQGLRGEFTSTVLKPADELSPASRAQVGNKTSPSSKEVAAGLSECIAAISKSHPEAAAGLALVAAAVVDSVAATGLAEAALIATDPLVAEGLSEAAAALASLVAEGGPS